MAYTATLDSTNNLVALDQVKEHLGIEEGAAQVVEVTCAAGITTGEYFNLSSIVDDYYVWYNVGSGGGDPSVANRTALAVAVPSGSSPQEIGSATASAITAITGFTASVVGSVVTVANDTAGEATAPSDGDVGYTFDVTQPGELGDTTQDNLLTDYINQVSWLLNSMCDREIKSRVQTEYYDGPGGYMLYLDNPPVASLTLYQDSARAWATATLIAATDYVLYTETGKIWLTGTAFLDDARVIKAAYTGGWSTIPYDLQGLCVQLIEKRYTRRKSEGKTSTSDESGKSTSWDVYIDDYAKAVIAKYRSVGSVGG